MLVGCCSLYYMQVCYAPLVMLHAAAAVAAAADFCWSVILHTERIIFCVACFASSLCHPLCCQVVGFTRAVRGGVFCHHLFPCDRFATILQCNIHCRLSMTAALIRGWWCEKCCHQSACCMQQPDVWLLCKQDSHV